MKKVIKAVTNIAEDIKQNAGIDIAAFAIDPVSVAKGRPLRQQSKGKLKKSSRSSSLPNIRPPVTRSHLPALPNIPPPPIPGSRFPIPRQRISSDSEVFLSTQTQEEDYDYLEPVSNYIEMASTVTITEDATVDPNAATISAISESLGGPAAPGSAADSPKAAATLPSLPRTDKEPQQPSASSQGNQTLSFFEALPDADEEEPNIEDNISLHRRLIILFQGIIGGTAPVPWPAILALNEVRHMELITVLHITNLEDLKGMPGFICPEGEVPEPSAKGLGQNSHKHLASTPRRMSLGPPGLYNVATPIRDDGPPVMPSRLNTGARPRGVVRSDNTYVRAREGAGTLKFVEAPRIAHNEFVEPEMAWDYQLGNQARMYSHLLPTGRGALDSTGATMIPRAEITKVIGGNTYGQPELGDRWPDDVLEPYVQNLEQHSLPRLQAIQEHPESFGLSDKAKTDWQQLFTEVEGLRCQVNGQCSHHNPLHTRFYTVLKEIGTVLSGLYPDIAHHFQDIPIQPLANISARPAIVQYGQDSYQSRAGGPMHYTDRGPSDRPGYDSQSNSQVPSYRPPAGGQGGGGARGPSGDPEGGPPGGPNGNGPPGDDDDPPGRGPNNNADINNPPLPENPAEDLATMHLRALQSICANLDKLQNNKAPVSESRFLSALKALPWFSGQYIKDRSNVCTEATYIESSCDRWIYLYRYFCNHNDFGVSFHKRAFFERLTGKALKHMRKHYHMQRDLQQLVDILRLRFTQPRTFDDIVARKDTFARKKYEDIATFMDRYDDLLDDLRTVNPKFTFEFKQVEKQHLFLAKCTDIELKERLKAAGYDLPRDLDLAVATAQQYYNDRNKPPWSQARVVETDKTQKANKNSKPEKKAITINTVDTEMYLESVNNVATIICRACGKQGHYERDCLVQKNSRMTNIQKKDPTQTSNANKKDGEVFFCTLCKMDNHNIDNCWRLLKHLRLQMGIGPNGGASGGRGVDRGQAPRGNPTIDYTDGGRARGRGRGRGNHNGYNRNRAINNVNVSEDLGDPSDQYTHDGQFIDADGSPDLN